MSGEAKTPEVLEKDDERVAALAALEKELKEFSGGLPYDQARVIERTQDGFRTGVHGFYQAGLGLILLERHEGVQTSAQILERYFPGISSRSAYGYMQFARAASKLPNFKQFCLERGGYSKGLTMLQSCTEAEIQEFEETGEIRGYTGDEIDRMSVVTMKKALRLAKEKAAQMVAEATDKVSQENATLKNENETLKAALAEPDIQAAFKVIRAAEQKFLEGAQLLRKIPREILEKDATVRNLALASCDQMNRLVSQLEQEALTALNTAAAAEHPEL